MDRLYDLARITNGLRLIMRVLQLRLRFFLSFFFFFLSLWTIHGLYENYNSGVLKYYNTNNS